MIIFYGRTILPFVSVPHLLYASSLLLHAGCSSDLSTLASTVIHGMQLSNVSFPTPLHRCGADEVIILSICLYFLKCVYVSLLLGNIVSVSELPIVHT